MRKINIDRKIEIYGEREGKQKTETEVRKDSKIKWRKRVVDLKTVLVG